MSNTEEKIRGADSGWTSVEFAHIKLGDVRLEKRFRRMAEELSKQPEYPINQASLDAAATKAAYRFFDNEKVTADKILSPHITKTLGRMKDEGLVLAIQDSTKFDFSSHKKKVGVGPIGRNATSEQKGLMLHSTFAVTPAGLPLGLLTHECWSREGFCDSMNTSGSRRFEEKESYKWVKALRAISEMPSSTRVVHVADRECDIYEFLREAQELKARYVIRACYNRRIESDDEYSSIQEKIKALPIQDYIALDVPSEKRVAHLELRFAPITITPPHRVLRAERVPIETWVVHVREPEPPPKSEPISWTLLTNLPVNTIEDACDRLAWYRRRWAIEEFHKILKSGCAVEDCRLIAADRLQRYIALFCVIAWRIFWMVRIQRANPKAPAITVLTQSEIGAICSLDRFAEKKLSPGTLTVRQAVIAIAALGGYLSRASDPPPGCEATWRGWQRLASMTEMYDSLVKRCG